MKAMHEYLSKIQASPLRVQILSIFLEQNTSMGAYEVLGLLKKVKPNAEPPTVYRVLDYLIKQDVLHKVSGGKKYILCQQKHGTATSKKNALLFTCHQCSKTYEYADDKIGDFIEYLTSQYHIKPSEEVLDITGVCHHCITHQHNS